MFYGALCEITPSISVEMHVDGQGQNWTADSSTTRKFWNENSVGEPKGG